MSSTAKAPAYGHLAQRSRPLEPSHMTDKIHRHVLGDQGDIRIADSTGKMKQSLFAIGCTVLASAAVIAVLRRRRHNKQRAAAAATIPSTKESIKSLRAQHCCSAQSVSYANSGPLLIMRGEKQFLYDETGKSYLDTRNNVCHIGHCHPAVVDAVAKQVARLNTNTRYLHPNLVALASELVATMPATLNKVFFVNSGSEANDLALRLARAHTGRQGTVVVDHAYHGHSIATIGISPYKFDHPRCPGKPDWVYKVSCPDFYRGSRPGESPEQTATRFAGEVVTACAVGGVLDGDVAAMFVESGMSVGGVILPPPGYLQRCFAAVRAAGGVCVADEVQVGFGRFGSHFWGFQQQDVVPDIVTMGKPFGNGMPLAAVVTTKEIAESFASGPEYFNTFGGNPVSCAAGLAVLRTLVHERLQENALETGLRLMDGLRALMLDMPTAAGSSNDGYRAGLYVGDVRGSGLFIGVEFVRDLQSKKPATAEASWLCTRLKTHHRMLTSLDGPADNVMVIKPPMCFSIADADDLVAAIKECLDAWAKEDFCVQSYEHTPT